uniref:Uncharacterized protein n=1 Tax=Anguilla anguilla TaxID=7936 RepID=A0A0E9SAE5_ANGAN
MHLCERKPVRRHNLAFTLTDCMLLPIIYLNAVL